MNLHEYQGKALFSEYGLPVSTGHAVKSVEAAVEAAKSIGGHRWVMKAQVHAGGRGKSGGVKVVESTDEVAEFAKKWLGKRLVTHQTDANGQPVSCIPDPSSHRARVLFHGFHASHRGPLAAGRTM